MASSSSFSANDRRRGWCATLAAHSVTETELQSNCEALPHGSWAYFGYEISNETEYHHWQGCIYVPTKVSFGRLKEIWPEGHFEPMKGTVAQAYAYCRKDKDEPYFAFVEHNPHVRPVGQGKRNDLLKVYQGLKEKKSLRDMIENGDIRNYQGLKTYELLRSYEAPAERVIKAWWLWGPTGVGKSHCAFTCLPDAFVHRGGERYMGRYGGESDMVWDEYDDSPEARLAVLAICDKWRCHVRQFGGLVPCAVERIIITSHNDPQHLFGDRWSELERRLEKCVCVESREQSTELMSEWHGVIDLTE